MFKQTRSVMVYVTCAALTISLMVCSVLSPIQVLSVGERMLRVYGVALVYDLPPGGSSASSGGSSQWCNRIDNVSSCTSLPTEAVQVRIPLEKLPPSTLKNVMTAYLSFASLCLCTCLSLLISVMVELLPTKHGRAAVLVTRVLTMLVPLTAVLCFAMAAVLGLRSSLYCTVAAAYCTDMGSESPASKLHSGFFSSVGAVIIGLLVAMLPPVLKW
ncbi:hypothetical protein LSCM1_01011 [Leishmania martiniquensis]|uniref:Uncharacterized protein n=1 Tax=Leishmania martiniquensis TaxID=1580590 RepID=A0A836K872_9TRYP|nr:hypothetical protein LSCM1_01011 [Leishmania martiniquensis]